MRFVNPHYFSAILDGINHRFVLVLESESLATNVGGRSPPRFALGAINATKDPRNIPIENLIELNVVDNLIRIPQGWFMAHNFIWVVNENTDDFGWEYRRKWPSFSSNKPEPSWDNCPKPDSRVRRRLWMSTVVPGNDLLKTKHLLSENLSRDDGQPILQSEMLCYNNHKLRWVHIRLVLFQNRIVFTYGKKNAIKTTRISLEDLEVIMLDGNVAYPGHQYTFALRTPNSSVGLLLDAENNRIRRMWVMTLQYLLAITTPHLSFPPFLYAPPILDAVVSQVLLTGELLILTKGSATWIPNQFQLLPHELLYFSPQTNELHGRFFLENASILAEPGGINFALRTSSGLAVNLVAGNEDAKILWVTTIRQQIQAIDNMKLKLQTYPKEFLIYEGNPGIVQLSLYRNEDNLWNAPIVTGENNDYCIYLWSMLLNHLNKEECSEELQYNVQYLYHSRQQQLQQQHEIRDETTQHHLTSRSASTSMLIPFTSSSSKNNNPHELHHHQHHQHALTQHSKSVQSMLPSYLPLPSSSPTSRQFQPPPAIIIPPSSPHHKQSIIATIMSNSSPLHRSPRRTSPMNNTNVNNANTVLLITDANANPMIQRSSMVPESEEAEPAPYHHHHSHHQIQEKESSPLLMTTALSSSSTKSLSKSPRNKSKPKPSSPPPVLPILVLNDPLPKLILSTMKRLVPNPTRIIINPQFVLTALKGITHRFLLVMENQYREEVEEMYCTRPVSSSFSSKKYQQKQKQQHMIAFKAPGKFVVGGNHANKDPRTVPLDQLIGITNESPGVQLPSGWCMLHQYIYIIQQNTDDDGWQYRSTWSDGVIASREENWLPIMSDNSYCRRRVWMTTVVKREDVANAKRLLSDAIHRYPIDAILEGTLLIYLPRVLPNAAAVTAATTSATTEENSSAMLTQWKEYQVILYHDKLEMYEDHEKVYTTLLVECEILLYATTNDVFDNNNKTTEEKENTENNKQTLKIRLRHPVDNNITIWLTCKNHNNDLLLQWYRQLVYQTVLLTPEVNFLPFIDGPPTGIVPSKRLYYADTFESYHLVERRYYSYHIELNADCLLCYSLSREQLLGCIPLRRVNIIKPKDNTAVTESGNNNNNNTLLHDIPAYDFIISLSAEINLVFRTYSEEKQLTWIKLLRKHISMIELSKRLSLKARQYDHQHCHSISRQRELTKEANWTNRSFDYDVDDAYMKALEIEAQQQQAKYFWPGVSEEDFGLYHIHLETLLARDSNEKDADDNEAIVPTISFPLKPIPPPRPSSFLSRSRSLSNASSVASNNYNSAASSLSSPKNNTIKSLLLANDDEEDVEDVFRDIEEEEKAEAATKPIRQEEVKAITASVISVPLDELKLQLPTTAGASMELKRVKKEPAADIADEVVEGVELFPIDEVPEEEEEGIEESKWSYHHEKKNVAILERNGDSNRYREEDENDDEWFREIDDIDDLSMSILGDSTKSLPISQHQYLKHPLDVRATISSSNGDNGGDSVNLENSPIVKPPPINTLKPPPIPSHSGVGFGVTPTASSLVKYSSTSPINANVNGSSGVNQRYQQQPTRGSKQEMIGNNNNTAGTISRRINRLSSEQAHRLQKQSNNPLIPTVPGTIPLTSVMSSPRTSSTSPSPQVVPEFKTVQLRAVNNTIDKDISPNVSSKQEDGVLTSVKLRPIERNNNSNNNEEEDNETTGIHSLYKQVKLRSVVRSTPTTPTTPTVTTTNNNSSNAPPAYRTTLTPSSPARNTITAKTMSTPVQRGEVLTNSSATTAATRSSVRDFIKKFNSPTIMNTNNNSSNVSPKPTATATVFTSPSTTPNNNNNNNTIDNNKKKSVSSWRTLLMPSTNQ